MCHPIYHHSLGRDIYGPTKRLWSTSCPAWYFSCSIELCQARPIHCHFRTQMWIQSSQRTYLSACLRRRKRQDTTHRSQQGINRHLTQESSCVFKHSQCGNCNDANIGTLTTQFTWRQAQSSNFLRHCSSIKYNRLFIICTYLFVSCEARKFYAWSNGEDLQPRTSRFKISHTYKHKLRSSNMCCSPR